MVDVVNDVIINYKSVGLDKVGSEIKQTSVSLDGLVVSATGADKATASLENRFKSLERTLGTTSGQQQKFEKAQRDINLAVAQNPALQGRANEALAAAEAKYLSGGKAAAELAVAHKGLDAQGQAALHSVRSVVEQLALGIPPTQALTGQINHLTYAASGEGGLAGAFKQVGGFIGGLITPTTIAIAGVTALTAAAVAAAVQLDKVQVSSQRAISGAGARTGATVSDLNTFTSQNASGFSGTGLSTKEARQLGEDLTATGDVVISRLHGMSDAVVGFSNQTGQSMSEASKAMVGFAVDPKKALDELSKTYGTFDAATRKAVETLVLADDKTGAFQVVLDALSEKSKKAAENMGFFEKAARAVVNVLATETVKPSGLEDKLEAVRGRLNSAIEGAPSGSDARAPAASAEIARLSREFENLQQAREAAIGQAAAENFNKLNTEAERSRERVSNIAKSWGDVGTATALALQALQDQLPIAGSVTTSAQMTAQYYATINTLLDQGRTLIEAEAIAAKQYEVSQATASANVLKQVESLKDQSEMIRAQQKGTEASTAAAIAYKNALASGADEASAAALATETARGYTERAAASALEWQQNLFGVSAAARQTQASMEAAADAAYNAARAAGKIIGGDTGSYSPSSEFAPRVMTQSGSFVADPRLNVSYRGGGTGKRLSLASWLTDNDSNPTDANVPLQNSIDKLRDSVEENTNALNKVTLNPLYTQGHGALPQIGYFHAASGLDVVAQGPSSGDQVPFHAMINGGERVQITKAGERVSNDNSRQIINNNNFVFNNTTTGNARRSQRHFAQGFGQIVAAGS